MNAKRERGALLILSLIMIVIVGGIAMSLLLVSTSGAKREQGRDVKFKSLEIAEAALDMAINDLRKATDEADNDGDTFIDEGTDTITVFGHADLSTVASLEGQLGRIGTVSWNAASDTNGRPDFNESGVVPVVFSGGEMYAWSIFSEADGRDNDGDGTTDEDDEAGAVMLFAVGRYNGIVSQVQWNGIFTEKIGPPNPPLWVPNAAIVTGGELEVTGSAAIAGTQGNIHANQDLDVQGAATVSGNVTGSADVDVKNPGKVKGAILDHQAVAQIPDVNVESWRPKADFILKPDGHVYDKTGGDLGTNFKGWKLNADGWTFSGGAANLSGTIFVEGDAKVTGMGKKSDALSFTVISTGNIHMAGNGTFKPYYQSIVFVAGGDIKITGTPDQAFEGIILAREQIFLAGNPDLLGVIMAANQDDKFDLQTGDSKITGNITITYNGGITTDIPIVTPSNKYVLDPSFAAYEER